MRSAALLSAAIGLPESRVELEIEFDSLSDLEMFWATIPVAQHKAWSQRVKNLIIDGSPTWQVYRTVEVSSSPSVDAHMQPADAQATLDISAMRERQDAQRMKAEGPSVDTGNIKTTYSAGGLALLSADEDVEAILALDNGNGAQSSASRSVSKQAVPESSGPFMAQHAPVAVNGKLRFAAGGAPPGSRLAAMVGDTDYL